MDNNDYITAGTKFKNFIRKIFMDCNIYETDLLVQDPENKGVFTKEGKIMYRRCLSKNYVRELVTNKKIPIKYEVEKKKNYPEICIEIHHRRKHWKIKPAKFDSIYKYKRKYQNIEELSKKLDDFKKRSNKSIRNDIIKEEKLNDKQIRKERKQFLENNKFVPMDEYEHKIRKQEKKKQKIEEKKQSISEEEEKEQLDKIINEVTNGKFKTMDDLNNNKNGNPKVDPSSIKSKPIEKISNIDSQKSNDKVVNNTVNDNKDTVNKTNENKVINNIVNENKGTVNKINENKVIVNENKNINSKPNNISYSTNYWANKTTPKVEKINVPSSNKTIEILAGEMEKLNILGNIAISNFEGIEISTKILKTKKDIVDYYNYKKLGIKTDNPNVKMALRAEKNINNRQI